MAAQQPLQFGPYRLDGASGQLWRHTQVVKLPPKATAVLRCLVSQAGQVVTKATLLDTVWTGTVVSEGVLTVCIRELRRALGDDARRPRYIETVHRRGYRFVASVEPRTARLPGRGAASSPGMPLPFSTPGLVGREEEVAQVQACLERAQRGQRQVLFITGEAGIGKTTLVDACVTALTAQETAWVGWGQCVDHYGPGTGYLPVLEALGRLCRGPEGSTVIEQLHQWAPAWLAQLTGVIPAADQARLQQRTAGINRDRMCCELAEALEALTAAHMLVLVFEDMHWSDPSTVDVLTMLARRREAARLVVLGTYRPVELVLRTHPLKRAKAELHLHGQCAEVALGALPAPAVTAYVAQRFPAPIAEIIAPVVYQRTAGHPLFMVHLATYLAQQAELEVSDDPAWAVRVAAVADTIPAGVQHLIELQLGQLHADEQRMLNMASVVGVEFAVASVAAGMQTSPGRIEEMCGALSQQGLFLETCGLATWPDGTVSGQYRFRHALYPQVLYRRLAEARRVQGHRRIGARLEAGYSTRTAEIAAALAVHFEQGRDYWRAVQYLQQAGENAVRRSALHEAIGLLTKGIALFAHLPETPERTQQELALCIPLGNALIAVQGYAAPDVKAVFNRALSLCQHLGDTAHLFAVLHGLHRFYYNSGEWPVARELAEQMVTLAQQSPDPIRRTQAHRALGLVLWYLGEFALAQAQMEQGLACYDRQQHTTHLRLSGQDDGVLCMAYTALSLWMVGAPAQAHRRMAQTLELAHALAHPFSLTYVLFFAAMLSQLQRQAAAVQEHATTLMALASQQGFQVYLDFGMMLHGWALAVQGQADAGLTQLQQGLATYHATQGVVAYHYFVALLADAHGTCGHRAEGLRLVAEALEAVPRSGRFWEAELYRQRGDLLLRDSPTAHATEAEACLQQARRIAQQQGARALELRAAMRLSRLWQQQGKPAAAHALLAPIYDGFTEGFDTVDLQEARALLEERA